jgi:hypothetical protein
MATLLGLINALHGPLPDSSVGSTVAQTPAPSRVTHEQGHAHARPGDVLPPARSTSGRGIAPGNTRHCICGMAVNDAPTAAAPAARPGGEEGLRAVLRSQGWAS